MIERDPEFEDFIQSLDGVGDVIPIEGGYRITVQLAESWPIRNPIRRDVIVWLKRKQRDMRVLWELHRPPWVDPTDPTQVEPHKPLIGGEYPRYVERHAPDPEFETFCLSVPDVVGLEVGDEYYLISVVSGSCNPVRPPVYRWMANNGRHFNAMIR